MEAELGLQADVRNRHQMMQVACGNIMGFLWGDELLGKSRGRLLVSANEKKCSCVFQGSLISVFIVFSLFLFPFLKDISASIITHLALNTSFQLQHQLLSSSFTQPLALFSAQIYGYFQKIEENPKQFLLRFKIPTPSNQPLTSLQQQTSKNHSFPFLLHISFLGTESKQGSLQFGVIRYVTVFLQVEQHVLTALLIEWYRVFEVVLRLQEKTRRIFHFETVEFLHHFLVVEQCGLWAQRFLDFGLSSHFACSNGVVSDVLQSLTGRCFSFGFLLGRWCTAKIVDDLEGIARRLIRGLGLHSQQIILIRIFRVVICACYKQWIEVPLNNKDHKKSLAVCEGSKTTSKRGKQPRSSARHHYWANANVKHIKMTISLSSSRVREVSVIQIKYIQLILID